MRGELRVGELRPSGRHEEPQKHQEGREEGGGGGHCGQEQCQVNTVQYRNEKQNRKLNVKILKVCPVISDCYVCGISENKIVCNLQVCNNKMENLFSLG